MSEEHQEYCESKVYPIVEKLVTTTLVERPELPVPFMVNWLADEFKKMVPTPQLLLQREIQELKAEIDELEARYNKALPGMGGNIGPPKAAHDGPWCFCFGPELSSQALGKHGVDVLVSVNVSVKGWRVCFNSKGIPMVEPVFANLVKGEPEDAVHGLAFQVPLEDMDRLDGFVPNYMRANVQFTTYTEQTLEGFLYTARQRVVVDEQAPSQRYLDLIAEWARDNGIAAAFVSDLMSTKTYKPSAATKGIRASLPDVKDLDVIKVEELRGMEEDGQQAHVAVMGYVIRVPRVKIHVGSHKNRDITARVLREFRNQTLENGADDMGKPPFPRLDSMSKVEAEYTSMWLDHYLDAAGGIKGIVGYLEEFRKQREGETQDVQLKVQKEHLAKVVGVK